MFRLESRPSFECRIWITNLVMRSDLSSTFRISSVFCDILYMILVNVTSMTCWVVCLRLQKGSSIQMLGAAVACSAS
jgi:hypothetical protein